MQKGRFAPSPSGRMHLGNLFCALLAWLSARSSGAAFVLRIEDLDTQRCRRAYAHQIEDDLAWLGLTWDEGGEKGGPCPPYYQSACTALYEDALRTIARQARVYPCFCRRSDLHAASAPHLADGTVLYNGRCARLSPEETAALAETRRPALRVAVPDETISFLDGCCGPVAQNLRRECGDFLLRRSDGGFAYQLAVVADDARMGVTQVVRGRDLLASTPRQIWLLRLLGAPVPAYCHVPLLVTPEGRRLSKREKSLDMGALRARFSPGELTGWLAFLAGLRPDPAPVAPAALLPGFSWEKIPGRDVVVPGELMDAANNGYACMKSGQAEAEA